MGVTLTNIIPNGSFEVNSDWSSTVYDTTEHYQGSRSSKLGPGSTISVTGQVQSPVVGHQYYGRRYIKSQGTIQAADDRFELYAGDGAGLNFVFAHNNGNYPDWTMQSSIITVSAVNGTSYRIRNFVVNAVNPCWTDCLMIIDLTAGFGSGNEPSKEWCDANIPYFEGSKSFDFYIVTIPEIVSASFSPNPASINQSTVLSVQVNDQAIVLAPENFQSNEIYSGEAS